MFRRLRYRLALQFTALVLALMLVVGGVFLGVQYFEAHRSANDQLRTDAAQFQSELSGSAEGTEAIRAAAADMHDASVRVFSAQGDVIFSTELFHRLSVPMQPAPAGRFMTVKGSGSYYRAYQVPLGGEGAPGMYLHRPPRTHRRARAARRGDAFRYRRDRRHDAHLRLRLGLRTEKPRSC